MSLETWKAEYYPVEADAPEAQKDDRARLEHSLRKWEGLREVNITKHGVEAPDGHLRDERHYLNIDAGSCALCIEHIADFEPCITCPLFLALNHRCDATHIAKAPYWVWDDQHNPEPMIAALQKALADLPK